MAADLEDSLKGDACQARQADDYRDQTDYAVHGAWENAMIGLAMMLAASGNFMTGAAIYRSCGGNAERRAECVGYVAGVTEFMLAADFSTEDALDQLCGSGGKRDAECVDEISGDLESLLAANFRTGEALYQSCGGAAERRAECVGYVSGVAETVSARSAAKFGHPVLCFQGVTRDQVSDNVRKFLEINGPENRKLSAITSVLTIAEGMYACDEAEKKA